MPTSRSRQPRQAHRDRLRARRRRADRPAGGRLVATIRPGQDITPFLTADDIAHQLSAIDEAARGDIDGTIEHELAGLGMEESLRVPRLRDLGTRDPAAAWAYSRWCVDQAMRWLLVNRDDRVEDATRLTLVSTHRDHLDEILDDPEHLLEYGTLVAACDWVCHQVAVFEYGGLRDFLAHRAQPSLIEKCDEIERWTDARMGVYRYLRTDGPALVLRDLVAGAEVSVLNVGAMSGRDRDAVVMGRIVPVAATPYRMFESRPILVDAETAMGAVGLLAADPSLGWLQALSEGREAGRLQRGFSCVEQTLYTSDLTVETDLSDEPAPRMQDLIGRGYSPDVANAVGVLEVGLIVAAVAPDAAAATAPHVAVALAVPGAFDAAAAECVSPDKAEAWRTLAVSLPDQLAQRCRELADRCAAA